jgi:hypothetical protein
MRRFEWMCAVVACLAVPAAAAGEGPAIGAWAYVAGGDSIAHVSTDQARHVEAARQAGGPYFWFIRDGREFVIRDAATLAGIAAVLEAPRGAQQRLDASEARQAGFRASHGPVWAGYQALADAYGPLGARESDLTTRRAGHRVDHQRTFWTREIDARDADFEARDRAFDDELEALGDELRAVADRVEGLEAAHRTLADEKLAWDRERRAAAHAWGQAGAEGAEQLRPLLDQALATGTALPVR